jgi:hypothetical protein
MSGIITIAVAGFRIFILVCARSIAVRVSVGTLLGKRLDETHLMLLAAVSKAGLS